MAKLERLSNISWRQPFSDRKRELHLWSTQTQVADFCKLENGTKRKLNIKFEDKFDIDETGLFQITSGREISFPKKLIDKIRNIVFNNPNSYFTVTVLDNPKSSQPTTKTNFRIGTSLTSDEWIEVLQDKKLTNDLDISIFQALYSFQGHKAPASQIGLLLGYKGKNTSSPLNSEIGRYGKRIAKEYNIKFTVRENGTERKWDIFFDGEVKSQPFIWKLKDELVQAIEETGLTGEQQYPDEIPIDSEEKLFEGAKRTIVVNSYERNNKARQQCIKHYGTSCMVCGFDFQKTYGKIGKDFIHVHHLTKVADIGNKYEVNPIKDLRPVCPNCHSMLHKQEPPLTIEELKLLLK